MDPHEFFKDDDAFNRLTEKIIDLAKNRHKEYTYDELLQVAAMSSLVVAVVIASAREDFLCDCKLCNSLRNFYDDLEIIKENSPDLDVSLAEDSISGIDESLRKLRKKDLTIDDLWNN